jgi:zinc-binding alcohol dehydrogenase family protein
MANVQKAIVLRKVGGDLEFEEIPKPTVVKSDTAPLHSTHSVHADVVPKPHLRLLSLLASCSPLDILVKVMACALNPVDMKIRRGNKSGQSAGSVFEPRKILGFDAAGIVETVGSEVKSFKPGDEVWYAGNIKRDGSFQQFQLVDSRLVSLKPKTLNWDEAAALPLTSITAYEALKEELHVQSGQSILITAGAGGVGSIATQLAKLWGLTVISTASRPETQAWTRGLGADHVIDHHKGIPESFSEQRLPKVSCCFNTFSDSLLTGVVPVVQPFGAICGINGDSTDKELPAIRSLFQQRIALHHEYMFGKAVHGVNEESVGRLLAEVAQLVDAGKLVTTMHTKYSWKDVKKAFEYLEGRTVIGKIVMSVDENRALHP